MGRGCIDPRFLDLRTSWRWVVSFTSQPFSSRGKSSRYPLDRKVGGLQNWCGRGENSWPWWDSNPDTYVDQPVASRYTDCAILTPIYIRVSPCSLDYEWNMRYQHGYDSLPLRSYWWKLRQQRKWQRRTWQPVHGTPSRHPDFPCILPVRLYWLHAIHHPRQTQRANTDVDHVGHRQPDESVRAI
jgi:hypothetical protein